MNVQTGKILVMSALLACACLALIGTAGADELMPCQQQGGLCNATAGAYGPGMMGNDLVCGAGTGYGNGEYRGMMGYGPYDGTTGGAGMMGGGLWILCLLFAALFGIVWLVAGILLIFWLLRQLQKEKPAS